MNYNNQLFDKTDRLKTASDFTDLDLHEVKRALSAAYSALSTAPVGDVGSLTNAHLSLAKDIISSPELKKALIR